MRRDRPMRAALRARLAGAPGRGRARPGAFAGAAQKGKVQLMFREGLDLEGRWAVDRHLQRISGAVRRVADAEGVAWEGYVGLQGALLRSRGLTRNQRHSAAKMMATLCQALRDPTAPGNRDLAANACTGLREVLLGDKWSLRLRRWLNAKLRRQDHAPSHHRRGRIPLQPPR